jgi:hypothetical protein
MKKLLLILLCLSAIKSFAQGIESSEYIIDGIYFPKHDPVQIQLVNKTGHHLDYLIYENMLFKNIKNGDSTKLFLAQNFYESMVIDGKTDGIELDNTQWNWHCRGVPYKYEGKSLVIELTLDKSFMISDQMRIKPNLICVD